MDRVVTVVDVAAAVDRRFPVERAAAWDRVGLLAGDPHAPVAGVALALDPTVDTIRRAAELGANVLVTHHPAFLGDLRDLRAGTGPEGVVFEAVSRGIALVNAHTNLDRDGQAQRLIPDRLGFEPLRPLEVSTQPMKLVVVYAPISHADALRDAMAAAGAGRIGDYESCSFSNAGQGRFQAPHDAHPYVGQPGTETVAEEERIEMVCAARYERAVVAAAASAHPYEEPLIAVHDIAVARNGAALGMVSSVREKMTLRELAELAGSRYGCTPRVWGDPDTVVSTVASSTGSAGSLVGAAIASGAQALVAGEVRYHDALSALDAGLAIVELGHDVTEWPLVSLLESVVRAIDGISSSQIHVFEPNRGWWTPLDRER